MNLADVPFVGRILVAGPDDPVFDALLMFGPFVIVIVGLLGRSVPGLALALAYVFAIVINVVINAIR